MEISEEDFNAKISEAIEAATGGLVKKNQELLSELKEARKGRAIDPAELDKLQAKIDALEADLGTAHKTKKEQEKALKLAQDALASESGFTQKLLLDNGLTEALVKAGVATPMLPAVKAMLGSQAKVIVDGDARKAVIGDKDLTEFVSAWATTDEGKHFIAAPANGGGGASGGAGNGSGAKVWTREKFDAASHFERSEFAKAGGKVEG
jgi:flagellar capping protein FliD